MEICSLGQGDKQRVKGREMERTSHSFFLGSGYRSCCHWFCRNDCFVSLGCWRLCRRDGGGRESVRILECDHILSKSS
jgi:hypothetical protein